jgi:hypothetical protein
MKTAQGMDHAGLVENRARFGDYVYTPLEAAVATLRERRPRYPATETAIGATVPSVLAGERPVGVLFRQVGTPNYETRRVVRLCAQHGLKLVIWEYHDDRFAVQNSDKHALGKLGFYGGIGRNGGRRLEYVRIFDLVEMNGRRFREILTTDGEALLDFHHRLLAVECPELGPDALFDASAWFARHGGSAREYYTAFVSLFLRHAILFETFVLQEESERAFTRDVFLPAFTGLLEATGLRPLVVPAEREDWEGDDFWDFYPEPLRLQLGPCRIRDQLAMASGQHWATPSEREAQHRPDALSSPLVSRAAPAARRVAEA